MGMGIGLIRILVEIQAQIESRLKDYADEFE
jgi:hypothetical protein